IKAAFETLHEIIDDGAASLPPDDASDLQHCTRILGGHLQRLEDMLRDLLDLSVVEAENTTLTLHDFNLLDLSRDLRQTLGPLAVEKQIKLSLPQRGMSLRTDPRLLALAVKNLVENAIKYTPAGGDVSLNAEDTGSELKLHVADTGVGLSPENLERIFERFFQVDPARTGTNPRNSGRGTGLGLSIVKHAAASLGGKVTVQSEAGKGSTFTLTLPRQTLRD
ncbi:MAG: ATP-binding protein, partial [Planctomycetota bacterium]